MKHNFDERNKNIVDKYINGISSIKELSKEYSLSEGSIKSIFKKYLKKQNDNQLIIRYNKKRVLDYCNLEESQLQDLYNLFKNNNWNVKFDNKEVLKYNIEMHNLQLYAHLYDRFFIQKDSSIIFATNQIKYSEKDLLNNAKNILLLYIDAKLTNKEFAKYEFLKKYNVSAPAFYKYVNIIKDNYNELYQQYKNFDNQASQIKANYQTDKIVNLLYQLDFGKEDQGIIRPYDVIDLLMDFNNDIFCLTKVTYEMYKQKKLNISEYRIISHFLNINGYNRFKVGNCKSCYGTLSKENIESILNSYKEINCKKNANGLPIKGTGRIITYEEKLSVFNFLERNNIDINIKTYTAGLNRVILGIDLDNKSKRLTK